MLFYVSHFFIFFLVDNIEKCEGNFLVRKNTQLLDKQEWIDIKKPKSSRD